MEDHQHEIIKFPVFEPKKYCATKREGRFVRNRRNVTASPFPLLDEYMQVNLVIYFFFDVVIPYLLSHHRF